MRRLLPLLALAVLPACSSGSPTAAAEDGTVDVVAALYPYQWVAEQVGGEAVRVTGLTPAGVEPHDLELAPRQVAVLGEAELVLWSRGFQPAVDEALGGSDEERALDVATVAPLLPAQEREEHAEEGHAEEAGDPHLWLDPVRLAEVGKAVAERLADVDPDRAADYRARAADLTARLGDLDDDIRGGLTTCERRDLVTSHAAFAYLADRYDLTQVGIAVSPDAEPTPGRFAEVAQVARERGVTTVFFEELVSPRTAEQLAREVGARAEVLSPLEGPPDTGDYVSAMQDNLDRLRSALGCA